MTYEALITIVVLVSVIAALISNRISADLVLMAALAALVVSGVLSPERALYGFANPGIITIACLYIVASGLMETGAVNWVASLLLGAPKSTSAAQLRVLLPASLLSAVTNNTAVVTMFIPVIQEWGERLNIRPSKLLIPLSYAAILGGTCTLIGTSTNLIVDGLLQQEYDLRLGLFEISLIGIPITLAGALYLYFFADRLLPSRGSVSNQVSELREYCVEFVVDPTGPLQGKSIAAAGLRNLNSGYLMEIHRGTDLLAAIDPSWTLQGGDSLVFIGAPELASELRKFRGMQPVEHQSGGLSIENNQRCIVEIVLGPEFPGIGKTIKESRFRTRYNAVVLSLSRGGKRQPGKLGTLEFKVGDTLLVETSFDFVEQYRFRKDFLLVSPLNNSTPPDYTKAPRAILILLLMIGLSASGFLTVFESVLLASGGMIAARCVTATKARRQIDLRVLIVIAASFALGAAMKDSGAADAIASVLLPSGSPAPMLALGAVYLLTVLFTEVMTNNAAAVLMFPVAQSYCEKLDVSIVPFAIIIMVAASASFITPLGYQTNLMVYGPGQYKFTDYIKIGLPLSILVAIVTITLVPMIWQY
ncbi:SLC13 family permease [Teredinibacter waterburyi]|uniref:SLC13 family permease n=1 Tax=Teredinibacter waterburyi TaxID=1500538 RepID=UPI00165F8E95|nr:SLC13 family permease [Teredinibacter waterburyi]